MVWFSDCCYEYWVVKLVSLKSCKGKIKVGECGRYISILWFLFGFNCN